MKPGETTSPPASMVVLPARGEVAMAVMVVPSIPMLAVASKPESGSMTRPPLITVSKMWPAPGTGGAPSSAGAPGAVTTGPVGPPLTVVPLPPPVLPDGDWPAPLPA